MLKLWFLPTHPREYVNRPRGHAPTLGIRLRRDAASVIAFWTGQTVPSKQCTKVPSIDTNFFRHPQSNSAHRHSRAVVA
jgi:hypothetical protein